MNANTVRAPRSSVNAQVTPEWATAFFTWLGSAGNWVEAPRRGLGLVLASSVDEDDPSLSWVGVDWIGRQGGREVLLVEDALAIRAGPAVERLNR